MSAPALEIETKFDVSLSYVVPALDGVDGVASVDEPVEHRLEAQYFDTADLRPARARITLRRRTGGAWRSGWAADPPDQPSSARKCSSSVSSSFRVPPLSAHTSSAAVKAEK